MKKCEDGFLTKKTMLVFFEKYLRERINYRLKFSKVINNLNDENISMDFYNYLKYVTSEKTLSEKMEKYDVFDASNFIYQIYFKKNVPKRTEFRVRLFKGNRHEQLHTLLENIIPVILTLLFEDYYKDVLYIESDKYEINEDRLFDLYSEVINNLEADFEFLYEEVIKSNEKTRKRNQNKYEPYSLTATVVLLDKYLRANNILVENGLIVGNSYPPSISFDEDKVAQIAFQVASSNSDYDGDYGTNMYAFDLINMAIFAQTSNSEQVNFINEEGITKESVNKMIIFYNMRILLRNHFREEVYSAEQLKEKIGSFLKHGHSSFHYNETFEDELHYIDDYIKDSI